MGTVAALFTNILTYFDYTKNTSANYVNASLSSAKIAAWVDTVSKYQAGIYVDCSS